MKNLNDDFNAYTGTENYYKHWIPAFLFTDGVKAVADKLGAYWFIDIIVSYQTKPSIRKEAFQIWQVESKNNKAVVVMKPDSDKPSLVKQYIEYTDLPEGLLTFWLINEGSTSTIILPSEY